MKTTYLKLAISIIQKWIPYSPELLYEYCISKDTFDYYCNHDYIYTIMSFPEIDASGIQLKDIYKPSIAQRIVLLVFNHKHEIIADMASIYVSTNIFMKSLPFFNFVCEESDWCYLQHYILSNLYFSHYEYPYAEHYNKMDHTFDGNVILYTNAYVTKRYRRQHLFSYMLEFMNEFCLRNSDHDTTLYEALSLDPDIACYGEDTRDEPYYYSYEKDEPIRLMNARIMKNLDYQTVCLDDLDELTDGCKRWFAYSCKHIIYTEKN